MADSSAIIAFILKEPGWERLARYMKFVTTIDLALKELYNAVWKASKLLNRIDDPFKVIELAEEYFSCCVEVEDQRPLLKDSLSLALRSGLTVYDSLFVVLALRKGEPLLSLDSKQRRVAEALGLEVLP